MKAIDIIKNGSNLLKEGKIQTHIIDSELLLSKILNKTREEIIVNLDKEIDDKSVIRFNTFIQRRIKNEPIAYILGEKEFWSKKFKVNKYTLIPRPETELLVQKLIDIYYGKRISILDIGTGSGCIILSLLGELKKSFGTGVDISKNAVSIAKSNAKEQKLNNRVKFLNKSFEDIFSSRFDLIVSNPPYIDRKEIKNLSDDIKKHEPIMALNGGNDGLDLIKKVIYKSKSILKIKGMLALEIGNEQIKKVSKILTDNNFRVKYVVKDYKNNVRCVFASQN